MSLNMRANQDRVNALITRAEVQMYDHGGFTEEFRVELKSAGLGPDMVLHQIRRMLDDEVECFP